MNKKKLPVILPSVLLLITICLLRIYRLGSIPLAMHIDETGLGLNAWSIANYGTDRYGSFLPITPLNFYGEQSAFYTYFCALLVKFFGLNLWTLRLPAAIMGILAVVFGALIMREIWGNKGWFTGLLLMGSFPYYIMNSRYALDCNAMLGTLTIALYALIRLLRAVKEHPDKKYYGMFALAGFLFSIVLYTYIIAAIAIGVFALTFGICYLVCGTRPIKERFLQLLCMALPMIVLIVPLLLVVLVNFFDLPALETPVFTIPKLFVDRTEEVMSTGLSLKQQLVGLLRVLTTDFNYGSSNKFWTMYQCSVPFVIIGGFASLINGIKQLLKKEMTSDLILVLLALGEVILFLLCGQYNYHINGIYIVLSCFCVRGIFLLLQWLGKIEIKAKPVLSFCFAGILTMLYSALFLGFCSDYFFTTYMNSYRVYGGAYETYNLLTEEQKKCEIFIVDEVGEFFLLSNPLTPEEYAVNCDTLGYLKDYHNLHFREPAEGDACDIIISNKSTYRNYDSYIDHMETAYYEAYIFTETK